MKKSILQTSRTFELTSKRVAVSLCADQALRCGGELFVPDAHNAFVEFELAHGYPVSTVYGTGIHPQVVANSFMSLKYKVFDLAHFIRSYNPKEFPKDVVLGTILAVEFPNKGNVGATNWTVGSDRGTAPGIRAVAVMHKQLDRVPEILSTWKTGQIEWTVSMEQSYPVDPDTKVAVTSGYLVETAHERDVPAGLESFVDNTPADLRALNRIYVPCLAAPADMNALFDCDQGKILGDWHGCQLEILYGGLNGEIWFKGAGLCPLGAEPEARVAQMLASNAVVADVDNLFAGQRDVASLIAPMRKLFAI